MAKTTAIIAEDEEQLRRFLHNKLAEVWPELHILGVAENGKEALALIERLHSHVDFLDIRMLGISGMDVDKNVDCISDVSRSVTGRGVIRLKDVPDALTISRSCMHLFKQM
jgi:DNA-binding NtrC family response regulator